jgi:hypothetical protein
MSNIKSIYQTIFSLLLVAIMTVSCIKSGTSESFNEADFLGKTFDQIVQSEADPELGGPGFIKFNSKNNTHIKFGDIVFIYNFKISSNKIIFEELNTKEVLEFSILSKNKLKDKYGVIWEYKEQN